MLYGRGILIRVPIGYNLARYIKDKNEAKRLYKKMSKLYSSFENAQKYADLIRLHYSTKP